MPNALYMADQRMSWDGFTHCSLIVSHKFNHFYRELNTEFYDAILTTYKVGSDFQQSFRFVW